MSLGYDLIFTGSCLSGLGIVMKKPLLMIGLDKCMVLNLLRLSKDKTGFFITSPYPRVLSEKIKSYPRRSIVTSINFYIIGNRSLSNKLIRIIRPIRIQGRPFFQCQPCFPVKQLQTVFLQLLCQQSNLDSHGTCALTSPAIGTSPGTMIGS